MRLRGDDLVAIAARLHDLESLDIKVTEFELHGNICTVESTEDQMDGRTYYLTDVNPKKSSVPLKR